MSKPKKTSDTSIRVLETLKFFSKNKASIQDVLRHFEKIDPNNKIYTSEVILKYINTLKVFGFRFIKQKDKYVLLNSPLRLDFNANDLEALCAIEKISQTFQEEKIRYDLAVFLQDLEKYFSEDTKAKAEKISKIEFDFSDFDYSSYAAQIKEYERYCIDMQRLKITYNDRNSTQVSEVVEPLEIKYFHNNIYLSVYNPLSAQIQDIDFNSIINVVQMPQKSNSSYLYTSVTFQIKDRLASAYKLHENEKLLHVKPDGSHVILNQKEDRTLLLKRLMRYGTNCEVLSPQTLRAEMKELIKSTLNNY